MTNLKYNGKIIGTIDGKIFRKFVVPSKHKMRVFDAYGIQKIAFDHCIKKLDAVIIEEQDGDILSSVVQLWIDKGIVGNYGDGEQIFLPVRLMENKSVPKLL